WWSVASVRVFKPGSVCLVRAFSSLSSFFSFYCSGDPLDLHSFPTRRSSDLRGAEPRERHPLLEQPQRFLERQVAVLEVLDDRLEDRKSTRLNSSHDQISYAVFCLKKKKQPSSTRYLSPT